MVKAGLVTQQSMVADYLANLVGDRAEKRKESIALGLSAADERDKVAKIMRSNAEASGGISDAGSRVLTTVLGPDSSRSAPGHTLGSATFALPTLERRRGRILATVGAVLVLGTAAAVSLFSMGSSRSTKVGASAMPAVAPPGPPPQASLPPIPPAPTPSEDLPATAAPSASTSTAQARPPARWVPATSAAPKAATRPVPSAKRRVNDGF